MFLNSSVRGPFVPSYMPATWQWHQAFTQRLQGDVVGVCSSLVCLPDMDAGGPGPKMESWAFALTRKGQIFTDHNLPNVVTFQQANGLCKADKLSLYGSTSTVHFACTSLVDRYSRCWTVSSIQTC